MSHTEFKRFINEGAFDLTDDEIRVLCKEFIGICYGSDNYRCDLDHINALKEVILKDYPDIQDKDIEVWHINSNESIRHAKFTMLRVSIPTEDFIKLRHNGEIYIL